MKPEMYVRGRIIALNGDVKGKNINIYTPETADVLDLTTTIIVDGDLTGNAFDFKDKLIVCSGDIISIQN